MIFQLEIQKKTRGDLFLSGFPRLEIIDIYLRFAPKSTKVGQSFQLEN
jgi:hypothetical protein